jgi:DNA-binding response OmpR family regulator
MPNILLVDDDPTVRAIAADALRRPYRTIHVAVDGEEALEHIAAHKPDLILTDVIMPRMDGWTLVRRLRTTPSTAFIPVIFMTALTTAANRIRGFRIGADDYIPKPLDLDELELRVENVLHHTRSARAGAGLTGDLSQFGLATPLTILELEHKSGLLLVDRPPEHALLVVKDGRIVRAELTDHTGCTVVDCVAELLTWSTGRFSFNEQVVNSVDDAQPTTALLIDAARKMDELIPVDLG